MSVVKSWVADPKTTTHLRVKRAAWHLSKIGKAGGYSGKRCFDTVKLYASGFGDLR